MNPCLLLTELSNLCCKREDGWNVMLVLSTKWSSLNWVELPEWLSGLYQHQHTVVLIAYVLLWITGYMGYWVPQYWVLVNKSPWGTQDPGQVENAETVSCSIYSWSQSNLCLFPPQNTPLGCFVNSCATVDLNLNRFLMILTWSLLKQVEGTHTHSSSSKGLEDVVIKKRENETENCENFIRNKNANAKSLTVIHL